MLAALRPEARGRIRVAQNGGWGRAPGRGPGYGPGYGAAGDADPRRHAPTPGYILYVGSLSRRKNIHGVLAVAVRLAREDGLRTLIVGGGSEILAPIAGNIPPDVAHLVRFTGPVTELDALGELYRNAGCLLFPSFYEASPLPPVEAMHFGCPVVVSAIPAMTERCGTAAIYCDPHDVDDMAAAVRRALADPALLAARGQLHAAHWTWRDQAVRVLAAVLGPAVHDENTRRSDDAPAGVAPENGFLLADADEAAQQAPCPRSTEGTVSSKIERLSASERERA
jgi:glycosyltransferase involved in cell wall biosynthesis